MLTILASIALAATGDTGWTCPYDVWDGTYEVGKGWCVSDLAMAEHCGGTCQELADFFLDDDAYGQSHRACEGGGHVVTYRDT